MELAAFGVTKKVAKENSLQPTRVNKQLINDTKQTNGRLN